MSKIWVRVKEGPAGLKMTLRKPGLRRAYWTETPEEVDESDHRVQQLLHRRQLIRVDEPSADNQE